MLIMWAIASEAEHASATLSLWARRETYARIGETIRLETLRLFETEEKGIQGLKEFRENYDVVNYVPRSGLIHGSADEWHLWRVEYHEYAERVEGT